jgi:hypothetical protein
MIGTGVGAETLTECGQSDGYAYYFSSALVPADKSGWKHDGVDGSRIILNFTNGKFDLLTKDAIGSARSVEEDGGTIFVRKSNNGLIALTVIYDADAATFFVFQIDDRGNGTMVSSLVRTAATVNMSLMMTQCRGVER